ncbi:MAG: FtsQ-type POTRA domain-containing protein [Kiritimatiellaceae bacterium]|nr:FtsQ-type POTRA domain-containing protein [Kiritimatiellaceae bacterium]
MAARKKTTTKKKPQYVRAKKSKGAATPTMARRGITVALLLLIIGGILFGLKQGFDWIGRQLKSENPRFEIQHIEVACDGKLTEDYIREITGLREGMNLWEFTFEEIEEKLMKVSRIESVYLERKLSNTMIVRVKERVPVSRIVGRQTMRYPFLVDRFQVVLPHRRSLTDLPLIKGLDMDLSLGKPVQHADVETALKIVALCDRIPYLQTYVQLETIDLQYADYIYLYLRNGARARVPRYSLEPRLYKLASTIKVALDQGRRVKTADVTLDTAKVPVTYY